MVPLVLVAFAVFTSSACGVLIGHDDLPERSRGPDGGADGTPPRVADGAVDGHQPAGTLDRTFGDRGFATVEWSTMSVAPSLILDGEDILLVLAASEPGLAIVRCSQSGICDTSHPTTVSHAPYSVSRVVPVRDTGGGVGLFYGLQPGPASEYENVAHLWRLAIDGGVEHLAQATSSAPTTQLEIGFATSLLRSVGVDNGGPRGAGRVNVRAFLQDGGPDRPFGQGGLAARALPVPYFVPADIALHDDGRIVVAGLADSAMWMRFEKNGAVDTSFGTGDGVGSSKLASEVREIALDDGGYVVGGSQGGTRGVLLRLDRDGRLDPSYWNGGLYRFESSDAGSGPPLALVGAMALGAGGTVLALGSTTSTDTGIVTLSRVSRHGLDTSFAQDGYAYIEEGTIGGRASMVIQADGKAIVTWLSAPRVVKLARFWVQ